MLDLLHNWFSGIWLSQCLCIDEKRTRQPAASSDRRRYKKEGCTRCNARTYDTSFFLLFLPETESAIHSHQAGGRRAAERLNLAWWISPIFPKLCTNAMRESSLRQHMQTSFSHVIPLITVCSGHSCVLSHLFLVNCKSIRFFPCKKSSLILRF